MLMSLALMTLICRRFAEGKKPYTALELKNMTGIPIRVTTDLLFRMRDVNLLTEITGNDGDEEPSFQPAQDIANINVGRIKELLDSYPNDRKKKLDARVLEVFTSEENQKLRAAYDQYMNTLNQVRVKEL